MTALLLSGTRIVTPVGVIDDGWLLADDGVILQLGQGLPEPATLAAARGSDDDVEHIVAAGGWLVPGFIDVHVHGALGHETMDGEVDGLAAMAAFYASHGVTSFLATTWTASTDDTLHALDGVARALTELDAGARLLGAHMEGPYLSARRCGAQDSAAIRPADAAEAARFLDTGVVRLMTVAPEVPGNLDLVSECVRRGVTVSAGHTDATYEQVMVAVDRGVRHVTHTFNAMRPLHHREPGLVGAAMTERVLTVEVIADGIHVHPTVLRALYDARGGRGIVLVTDAMRATGMPPGRYPIGDDRSVVLADGAVRLPDGALAGSVLTFDTALRNLAAATGRGPDRLWASASRNAAQVAGVADRKGAIARGQDADLVLLSEDLEVQLTVVEGRVVHRCDREATDQPSGSLPGGAT
ncbi:N-acetylglucosamine-6-phosphate deacetylase [Nitriliruptor alkaliphilus]|uniref:N-acetylglucosamine-6-phosphate deacetylase n=1 Tax=Nitriliruptor alkaliphilus TaxID=427918 RepID=UPI00069640C4|nr:N-acetylglucosamine-6-phosphate deacetylase [Nitriliruptor alkaliphilus]